MRSSLVLRADKPDRHGLCHIELVVHQGGRRTRYPSGFRVLPDQWSTKRHRVLTSHDKHADINRRIVELESRGKALEIDHPDATIDRIRSLLSAPKLKATGSFSEMALRVMEADKDLAYHTRVTMRGVLSKLEQFAPGIGIAELDAPVLRRYMAWDAKSGNSKNTGIKDVRTVRNLYNRLCEIQGLEPKGIAKGLSMVEDQGPPKFVPLDRIGDVLAYRSTREIRQLAADLWCFSFLCAGIRFTDLVHLKWKQFEDGWLNIKEQHKTGHFKMSELTPKAQAILDRYKGGTYVFKVCGDLRATDKAIGSKLSQINPELHAVSADLGIRPRMTTHTARHSWTEWALVNKVPYPLMMQMLGIKSMKSFLHYISRFNTVAVSDVYTKMKEAW